MANMIQTGARGFLKGAAFDAADAKAQGIREDFPILTAGPTKQGAPLVYLDSAATSQKPRVVIDAIVDYYENTNANVHRSIHRLGEEATAALESGRAAVADYIGAASSREIIFTRGTTESFNLLASSLCRRLEAGDEIILSEMEHHANIVPWHMAAQNYGVVLKFLPLNEAGDLELSDLDRLLSPRTKLVSLTHISNLLGTINPIGQIAPMVHARGRFWPLMRPNLFPICPLM